MPTIPEVLPDPESILSDPGASNWLKDALKRSLDRDPVDAINDAEFLCAILSERLHQIAIDNAGDFIDDDLNDDMPL